MINPIEQESIFLTTTQAARLLNVSLSTLKKLIYQGRIKTFKTPGGHYRILKSDLFAQTDFNPSVKIDQFISAGVSIPVIEGNNA